MARAFTLDGTYIHLKPDDSARILEGGERFWAGVEERRDLDHGRQDARQPGHLPGGFGGEQTLHVDAEMQDRIAFQRKGSAL